MLTAARWANQACEATVFDGEAIELSLLQPDNVRPLWNLYPDERLTSDAGRAAFLESNIGNTVDRKSRIWQAFAILSAFLVAIWAMTCWMLRRQDTL